MKQQLSIYEQGELRKIQYSPDKISVDFLFTSFFNFPMDFLHNLKKVTRSTSEKAKYFLEAKQNIKEVKIEYVNQSGRMSKRVILPKELYKNSRGTIYVQAYCNQAQESRTFLLNKITLVEVPEYNKSEVSAKPFAGRPVCSVTGCDNLSEIRTNSLLKYIS